MSRTATLALARAALQERFNRNWRFSRAKAGLWLTCLQLGLGAVASWRLQQQPAALGGLAALLAIATQAAVWTFFATVLETRGRLFGQRQGEWVHVSSAPASSVLAAFVLSGLPSRLWSMLLWAAVLALPLPGPARWLLPLLWVTGVVTASLAEVAALWLTLLLVQAWLRSFDLMWAGSVALMLGVLGGGAYVLTGGDRAALVLTSLVQAGPVLVIAGLALFWLPGIIVLTGLRRHPQRLADAYRHAWLQLAEQASHAQRPVRSRWPGLLTSSIGLLPAKDWLQALRNPTTVLRLALAAAASIGMFAARGWLLSQSPSVQAAVIQSAAAALTLFVFGEVVIAFFPNEGRRLDLYRLTGAPASRLMAGKLLAAAPLAVIDGLLALFGAGLAGCCATAQVAAFGLGSVIGLGLACIIVGFSAFDLAAMTGVDTSNDPALATLLEQTPRGPFSAAGLLIAAAFAAAVIWVAAPYAWASWLLPPGAIIAGLIPLSRLR